MERLGQLGIAVVVNATLLMIAAGELRRHRIRSNVLSFGFLTGLCIWTLAEIALYRSGNTGAAYAVLMGSIGVGAATDKAAGYILDVVTLPCCAFSIVAAAYGAHAMESLVGAAAVSGALLFLHAATRGRGLGLGDVKLAAAAGILLGARAGLIALGVSFIFGGCVAAVLLLCRRAQRKAAVPFAPYMAAGTLAALALQP